MFNNQNAVGSYHMLENMEQSQEISEGCAEVWTG